MKLRLSLQCMAASEIADMIPSETIAEIKRSDPTPTFRAYVIGHVGEAKGYLVGVGNIIKRWARDVIAQLYDRIQMGLALFHGHGSTNSHDGRIPIGRVVGKSLKDIDGRLSTVVACYIEPANRRQNLDVASIESEIKMAIDKTGALSVIDVGEVTGIALASSQIAQPGFPGATLLGQLAAFARKNNLTGIGYELVPPVRLGYRINKSAAQGDDKAGRE